LVRRKHNLPDDPLEVQYPALAGTLGISTPLAIGVQTTWAIFSDAAHFSRSRPGRIIFFHDGDDRD